MPLLGSTLHCTFSIWRSSHRPCISGGTCPYGTFRLEDDTSDLERRDRPHGQPQLRRLRRWAAPSSDDSHTTSDDIEPMLMVRCTQATAETIWRHSSGFEAARARLPADLGKLAPVSSAALPGPVGQAVPHGSVPVSTLECRRQCGMVANSSEVGRRSRGIGD